MSALCLSGGATFGYCIYVYFHLPVTLLIRYLTDHFGVLKAFVQAKLLPRIVTGTSAGGLVAALACTRTDEELERILVPELADNITACEEPFRQWVRRFWRTGARFDSVHWARKVRTLFISHSARGYLSSLLGQLLYEGITDLQRGIHKDWTYSEHFSHPR